MVSCMFIDVAEEAAVSIRNICDTLALVFHSFIHSFIHSFVPQSVLRQVHSLFQCEFSTECHLVLPFSIYTTLPFP